MALPASLTRPQGPTDLKVLVAGVGREERDSIEAAVRRALAERDSSETWSVSLVRLGRMWSVVLNGPTERLRNVSFSAEADHLTEAIREAIREPVDSGDSRPAPTASEPAGTSARDVTRDHHQCGSCQKGIVVSYEGRPGEPKMLAPVACPHCWAVSRVPIGVWAAEGGDYKAERA